MAEAQPSPVSAPVVEAVEQLSVLGGPRMALPAVAAPAAEPAAAPRPRPAAWDAHRAALERELARATELAGAAREETAARLAEHAAELALTREQAGARVVRAERLAAAAAGRARAAVAAGARAEARLRAETVAREALGRELELRSAEAAELSAALAAERAALAAARAEALAARRVRRAESDAAATLAGELEAERTAHAVTRGRATKLAEELAALRRAREAAASRPAADAARALPAGETAAAQPAAEAAAAQPAAEAAAAQLGDLRRRGLAQAAAAAAVQRPAAQAGRVAADLDAAAASLRRAAARPPRRLRDALVSLAREDPAAAGALIAQLLPAQSAVIGGPLSYDLMIRGVGTYAVTLGGGAGRVVALPRRRPPGQAELALTGDPLALAEWLAGAEVRIGRWRGRIRRRGRRRALAPLRALPASGLSLPDAARAGARLEPGLVLRALAHVIDPSWTRGHRFIVAQKVGDETWYLTARDGAGLAVSAAPPERSPDATVSLTRAAFDRLLRDEPPLPGARPSIRGDRAAVATLREWAERARGPRA